jgi:hypothetical protein
MGTVEHDPRCEQSRTERNTGIDGTKPDPTASCQSLRDNHRGGALTATFYQRLHTGDLKIAAALSDAGALQQLALTASSFFPRVLSKPVLKKKVSGCRKFERSGIIPSQDGENVRETLAAISRELKTFAS